MSKKDIKSKNGVVNMYVKMLPIAFKANKSMFITNTILNVIHGLSYGLLTFLMQYFFDTSTMMVQNNKTLSDVILALIILTLGYIFNLAINGYENFIEESYIEKAEGNLTYKLHEKISKIDPENYENTDFMDLLNKSENGMKGLLWFVQTITLIITFYPAYFIFMGFYLFKQNPFLIFVIILIFLPTIFTYTMRIKTYKKIENELAPLRRENEYYDKCCTDRKYFKETRMLGIFGWFFKRFTKTLKEINGLEFKVNIKNNMYELINKVFALICYIGIIIILFVLVLQGKIMIGAFAAIFASIGTLFDIMEEVIFEYMGRMSEKLGSLENYSIFMNYKEEEDKNYQLKDIDSISLHNLCYKYPNTEKDVLKNINLNIHKNEKIAIVGENGAGKSTLVKLIIGIYKPNSGSISYNKIDSQEISKNSIYRCFTSVFQKFQHYQMTLRDNIKVSNPTADVEDRYINEICIASGINIDKKTYPNGLDTMLSREFDGVDLSGGYWQRIAIARGLYRDCKFIVLDEPTSAIDPAQETKLYNKFAEIISDKTALIVTHRLGLTKLVDKIFVLENGQLVEVGSHEELMMQGGVYAKMYHTQEQWYN